MGTKGRKEKGGDQAFVFLYSERKKRDSPPGKKKKGTPSYPGASAAKEKGGLRPFP